ncbi:hypothetical protein [Saccharicrinis sp. FJH54]|uniref:hypothetical protein n=1 Tax=Saccharicrinis sp. FJH54 TaxID=3344665 RepID=UPI0035D4D1A5
MNIVRVFAFDSDPAFGIKPEEIDSASVSTSSSEILNKEMESFYSREEKTHSSSRKYINRNNKNDYFDFIQDGELIATDKEYKLGKVNKKPMWGEADLSFELEEMLRNYRELLKSYQNQLNWADKVKNEQISDLMNVKIKQTKKLIKECKRNLRKY